MGHTDDPDSADAAERDDSWESLLNDLIAVIPAELLRHGSLADAVYEFVLSALPEVRRQVASSDLDPTTLDSDLAATLLEAAHDLATAAPVIDPCTADVIAQRLRDLGFAEAHRGASEPDVRQMASLLARHAWRAISKHAADAGWKAAALGYLGTLLFRLREQAEELVVSGHQTVARPSSGTTAKKRQLIAALLADDSIPEPRRGRELRARARAARWEVPARLVVLRFRPGQLSSTSVIPRAALVDTSVAPARAIAGDSIAEQTIGVLAGAGSSPIAVSPLATPTQAGFADRLAKRVITLAESGVLPLAPVIRCDEHASLLWLHAEPEIRARMAQDLLSPLLAEHPTSRMVLAETMLAWLTTRDSAPAIARHLGVHPQTVRYRWRRLQELFGDQLHDPEFIASATLLLRATVPMWQRGDQADVEGFTPPN
ncbi:helix-turn-helix domain-containing protein [Nocardioides dubius]|uniref:Helix-turn-helix domain-containing protein n=1 Tax=Nocardioides dubius TaxID=317019 RepID=A0ABN1U0R9_9ACTN